MIKKVLFLALILRLLFVFGTYHPDLNNHLDWGKKFWRYGPKEFYNFGFWSGCWPNQPPGTMYLWAGISKINDFIFETAWQINLGIPAFPSKAIPFLETKLYPALIKLPSVLAEIGIGWLIYRILLFLGLKEKKALVGAAFFLFNPAVFYNSSIWGQTDSLINFFMLLAIFLLIRKRLFLGIFSIFLSFYFKLSLLIFLPLILLLLWKEKVDFKKLVAATLLSLGVFFLLSLPFMDDGPWNWFKGLYLGRILGGQGDMLTGNAFNLWAIFFGIDLTRPDTGWWLGVSYKMWGQLLFAATYLLIGIKIIRKKLDHKILFFSLALVSLLSFLLLTNMHERYLYPALPYLALMVGLEVIPVWIYVLISFIHLLNLYNLWNYPHYNFWIGLLEFNKAISVRVFSGLLLFLGLYLFWTFLFPPKRSKIK